MAGTYIDDLVTYLEQFSPNARAAIRGATSEQIAELEQLVGHPLPDDYRQYLERMGDVGINFSSDGPGSRAVNVIAYYEQVHASRQRVPDGYVVMAPGDRAGSIGLKEQPGREPSVVIMGDRAVTQEQPYADSLPKFLFRTVFMDGHNATFPLVGFADIFASHNWPERVRQAAEEAGLVAQWFSDSIVTCYDGRTTATYVNHYEPNRLGVRVWAQNAAEGDQVGATLSRLLRTPTGAMLSGLLPAKVITVQPSYTYRPQR